MKIGCIIEISDFKLIILFLDNVRHTQRCLVERPLNRQMKISKTTLKILFVSLS